MRIRAKTFYKILLFLLVFLPIYQDSPLSLYIGAAGYTVLMPFALTAIVLHILLTKKFPSNPRLKELLRLGCYLTVISCIAIFIWVICGGSLTVVSEFLPIKAFKVCLQYFSYPAYTALVLTAARKTGTKCIGKYAFVTLIVITLICIIEKQQSPYAFQGLHFAGGFPYWRIRLLTTESSWTTMMIYVYTALSLYWSQVYKKRSEKIITLACALILMASTGSKTLMMSVIITILIYVVMAMKRLQRKTLAKLLGAAAAAAVFAATLLPDLFQSLAGDIEQYTSVATRLYTSVIGFMVGVCFPCGVGGAVYLGVFQNALSRYLYIFSRLPIKFNTSEIVQMAESATDVALTVKSGILHYNMYWGILGTAYLMRNFVKVTSELKKNRDRYTDILWTAFWSAVIMMIFACNFTFEFWLLYAFLMCLNENSLREED